MSLRVVHTFGRNAGAVVTVDKPVVVFGRDPACDVRFDPDHDRGASSRHAEARFEGGAWVLVDVGSSNGTFVGGSRVTRHALRPGDEVTFGAKGPRVRVEHDAGAAAAADPLATAKTAPAPSEPRPAAQPPPAAPPPAAQPRQAPQVQHAAQLQHAAQPQHAGQPRHAAQPQHAASPHGPVVPAPAAGARVGQRTIAMMISSAVAAAAGRGRPGKTREIHALVDQRVDAATRGQRRTARTLGVLLLVALAGLGGLIWWGQQSQDQIAVLRGDLARLPPEDPRRKEIEGRLGTLHPANANEGRNLYERTKKGIFMLSSGGQGFCTAFAVRPSVLATNAHCVVAAKRLGGSIVALENEGRGQVSFSVSSMKPHPSYRENDADNLTPDVGVVTISGTSSVVLDVAAQAELSAAGAGDAIYLIGFPGRLMDASNPAATFLAANIGRITTPSGRPGGFADSWLLQHDASTTRGTSGSPIFNAQGKVIAINAGGYLEGDDQTIAGKKTEVVRESPYKFGMRIDLLSAVLR